MKFQIILDGPYNNDQEFADRVRKFVPEEFTIREARSLEGIREEAWKKPDSAEDLI